MKPIEQALGTCVTERSEHAGVERGLALPLGATQSGDGVNFALFSRYATGVRLELFEHPEDDKPIKSIDLDHARNRTGDIWHVWVKGVHSGQLYAYRVDGPYQPEEGHRFNFNKLLLDPHATAIEGEYNWDPSVFGHHLDDPAVMVPVLVAGADLNPDSVDEEARERAKRLREVYNSDYFRNVLRNDMFEKKLTDRLIEIATEGRGAVLNGFVQPEASATTSDDAADENASADADAEEPAAEVAGDE